MFSEFICLNINIVSLILLKASGFNPFVSSCNLFVQGLASFVKIQQGTYLRHKYSVDFRVMHKVLENLESLPLRGRSVQVWFVQSDCVRLQCEHIIREDNNLIVPLLVISDEKLAGSAFVRVHHIEQLKSELVKQPHYIPSHNATDIRNSPYQKKIDTICLTTTL